MFVSFINKIVRNTCPSIFIFDQIRIHMPLEKIMTDVVKVFYFFFFSDIFKEYEKKYTKACYKIIPERRTKLISQISNVPR